MNTTEAIELLKAKAQELCPGWSMDADNEQVVVSAAAWLSREGRQNIDLNKGLMVVGNVGTGKTMLMRIIRDVMRDAYGTQFGIRSCQEMVRLFSEEGYEGIEDWMNAPHVCFDDLGAEHTGAHYAVKTNLMAEVIEARYERLSSGRKCWTHFTTNLGTDQLQAHIGSRAYSRVRHMCNLLDLGASSSAVDRRATAKGLEADKSHVNADNVYTAIHPDVISRLKAAFPKAMKSAKDGTTNVPSAHTQEAHLVQLAAICGDMSTEDLQTLRERVEGENPADIAAPYLKIIDHNLNRTIEQ